MGRVVVVGGKVWVIVCGPRSPSVVGKETFFRAPYYPCGLEGNETAEAVSNNKTLREVLIREKTMHETLLGANNCSVKNF